jgi:hypothetical protein
MKIIVNDDDMFQMVFSNEDVGKIGLCNEHSDKLNEKFRVQGIDKHVSTDVKDLRKKLAEKRIDPLYHATESLTRLAVKMIGSEGVVQHHCPVCAINNFDFVSQIAKLMRQALRNPA